MAHNIDQTTGTDAIAYIGSTPWHGLGKRITPEQGRDVEYVRIAAGLGFEVQAREIAFRDAEEWKATARGQAIIRTDTGRVLGIVGPNYTPIQNAEAFDVLRPAVEELGLTITVAGALDGGATGWALAKLPHTVDVTDDGDLVNGYALFRWSHDGTTSLLGDATPIRVVCQNTLNAAARGKQAGIIRVRHTASKDARLEIAQQTVTKLTETLIATGQTFAQLAKRQLSQREVIAFIEAVFPQEGDKPSDVIAKRRKTVVELLESGVGAHLANPNGIPTAWGAYNAVTEYFDHVRPREAKSQAGIERANVSALFGANFDAKRFALAQARQLVAA